MVYTDSAFPCSTRRGRSKTYIPVCSAGAFAGRYVLVQNVTSLAARKSMGQSNGVIDSVLLEAGQPGDEVIGENVVYLELGVDWTSYRSKVIR